MCPSVSVLTRENAERDAFVLICLTNDVGDGTRLLSTSVVRLYSAKIKRAYVSKSAALNSVPSGCASWTSKNLLFRMKTTWLCVAGSNLWAVSLGIAGYRLAWKLDEGNKLETRLW
jgi:hypothetical protein